MTNDRGVASARELRKWLKEERAKVEALEDLVRSALGEIGDFPPLPDDWPKRPYYWRSWLREQYDKYMGREYGGRAAARKPTTTNPYYAGMEGGPKPAVRHPAAMCDVFRTTGRRCPNCGDAP